MFTTRLPIGEPCNSSVAKERDDRWAHLQCGGAMSMWGSNVSEPDALPQVKWLRRVAEVAGIDTTVRTGPAEEQSEAPPLDWHSTGVTTWPSTRAASRRNSSRTELKFAEEISHQQALVRSVLWEREEQDVFRIAYPVSCPPFRNPKYAIRPIPRRPPSSTAPRFSGASRRATRRFR